MTTDGSADLTRPMICTCFRAVLSQVPPPSSFGCSKNSRRSRHSGTGLHGNDDDNARLTSIFQDNLGEPVPASLHSGSTAGLDHAQGVSAQAVVQAAGDRASRFRANGRRRRHGPARPLDRDDAAAGE